jgi:hypothetical protein
MDRKKYNLQSLTGSLCFICLFCVLFFVVSGCAPLRKKFTRKKKEDSQTDQKFIPVLDPIDYPEKIYSAEQHYKHHYSLWQVWNKDLLQTLESDGSDKRQEYLLEQAIGQLEEMQKWLADAKQAELSELINELREVQQEYARPSSIRNQFSTRKKIERVAQKVRAGFSTKNVLPYRE